jgi:anti-anti-sigma regulatory factor
MLKVTVTSTAKEERWTLEGRLVAPSVDELKANWENSHCTAQGQSCIVDLDEVTCIDKSGEQMLQSMSNQGARFIARDVYVKDVLVRLRRQSH